ncbi:hypothetical protein HPB52_008208 [Rhipicephalus sanguineus]|uniref:Uncharacterized protein n=1 Tax=Rhipicephalus sanguineus TaxID=34632 RepID=A0A9D4PM20_RHISA|nr:hypothetical protein HPB52_008208 [Rhipicephalus sanguineus]
MIPLELRGALLEERRRSNLVPRPLSAPACLNHMSQECPEFAHVCCARRHHQYHVGSSRDQQEQDAAAALVKAGTIRQHYYPEGGWGWTVCACGFLVHLLSDGLLASHGFMIVVVQKKFRDAAPSSSAYGAGSVMKLGE